MLKDEIVIPSKQSAGNTKDILLGIGILAATAVAGIALAKNNKLGKDLEGVLKNTKEVETKLKEAEEKVQKVQKKLDAEIEKTKKEDISGVNDKISLLKEKCKNIFQSIKNTSENIIEKLRTRKNKGKKYNVFQILEGNSSKNKRNIINNQANVAAPQEIKLNFWKKLKLNFYILRYKLRAKQKISTNKKEIVDKPKTSAVTSKDKPVKKANKEGVSVENNKKFPLKEKCKNVFLNIKNTYKNTINKLRAKNNKNKVSQKLEENERKNLPAENASKDKTIDVNIKKQNGAAADVNKAGDVTKKDAESKS